MPTQPNLDIGYSVGALTFRVVRGQGFWLEAGPDPEQPDVLAPDGSRCEFRFASGTVWSATFSGGVAAWSQTPDDVDALVAGEAVVLWFVNIDDTEIMTNRGHVNVS